MGRRPLEELLRNDPAAVAFALLALEESSKFAEEEFPLESPVKDRDDEWYCLELCVANLGLTFH